MASPVLFPEHIPGTLPEFSNRERPEMHINGRRIGSTDDLVAVLAQNGPGSKVILGYRYKSNLGWMPKETLIILADK